MPALPTPFLGIDAAANAYDTAEIVVLPVPFERTTSYGKGTACGPEAILRASAYVETWDEELAIEPCARGIHTLPYLTPEACELGPALGEIERAARPHLEARKFLVALGGEHSLTQALVRAARAVDGPIGVVQFDAHADLRAAYEGTPFSHACVMRRIHDAGIPAAAIGLRSLSREEDALIRDRRLPVVWGHQLDRADALLDALLDALPDRVYLTFDLDFFDPSLLPATGTPEPGGGFWTPTMRLLRRVFARKDVIAMDVVELAPIAGQPSSDVVAAKLAYKCLGYRQAAGRRGSVP